ncbi:MAG: T9SS type A sorting domain-containing protein [Bacteroidia bacterium]|nr:T9SS type A sorting domain-containing protein [Bacteroidia bacterium]MBS1763326.1 T9SS type A sorting domain-containing protein [Bacteroidota bacterium]
MDTQANIADENGNILISSNGYFIANATGDTMQNGSGLNPNQCTYDYGHQYGLPIPYGTIILPMPDDSNKYVLFHQTCNYNSPILIDSNFYYSIIDVTHDNGLGEVISKNNVAHTDVFGWGIAACKHANGRDWWVVVLSFDATHAHTFLVTPDTIQYFGNQNLQIAGFPFGFAGQPTFSPDGEKFAFSCSNVVGMSYQSKVQLFDFDRCSGVFSLDTVIDFTDGNISYATAFSSNSKYLYFATTEHIHQINTDTSNIGATYQLVATNDTFLSAPPVFYTNFYLMYLAANGKIYITSTSGVLDLHEMDYPDSAGIDCTVNLHNIHLPCFNVGTVPNHPNYYLGRLVGSPCDTLTSVKDLTEHDFKFSVSPNPNNGNFRIMYLLPQNKSGKLEIFDINGRVVYSQNLPPWSTLQSVSLSRVANGVYNCSITSNGERVHKKLVVFNE